MICELSVLAIESVVEALKKRVQLSRRATQRTEPGTGTLCGVQGVFQGQHRRSHGCFLAVDGVDDPSTAVKFQQHPPGRPARPQRLTHCRRLLQTLRAWRRIRRHARGAHARGHAPTPGTRQALHRRPPYCDMTVGPPRRTTPNGLMPRPEPCRQFLAIWQQDTHWHGHGLAVGGRRHALQGRRWDGRLGTIVPRSRAPAARRGPAPPTAREYLVTTSSSRTRSDPLVTLLGVTDTCSFISGAVHYCPARSSCGCTVWPPFGPERRSLGPCYE